VVAALDVGFAVNPQQCRGQVEGAVAMGIELALGSDLALDAGVPRNASFLDYRLASTRDRPEVEVILVESMDPGGPYGAKGVGTPAMTPILPAICNAIRSATGHRIAEVPITPEAIWSAVGGRER
jgi:CO/xanthine dehydrogenase Mo-binding subunit